MDAALFIDADNVEAEEIQLALKVMAGRGLRVTIRRAYGGADRLVALREVLAANAVRCFANHGKGTTDALLIVDVMDLLHRPGFPLFVAIASADADFAPLAIRLREQGLDTLCVAHRSKSDAVALKRSYGDVVFTGGDESEPAPAKPARAARVARVATPRKSAGEKKPAPVAAPSELESRVRKLLATVPDLKAGRAVQLNEVVSLLRREGFLGKTGSGPKFLAKNAGYLHLSPDQQPNKVQWIREPA